MTENLDELIAYIARHFEFNEKKYPELAGKNEKEKLIFSIRHSSLHFSKTAGKISALSEDIDHGNEIDIDGLKTNTAKSLINTLRLAELIKLDEKELIELVKQNLEAPVNQKK
jgi:hypothetical protein